MRVKHQQLIVLKMLEILKDRTDRNHLLSSKDITTLLGKEYGYFIERKTLYHYIAELQHYYDIRVRLIRNMNYYYYAGKERLTSTELTLLLDAIDSFNFLPQKESEILKTKLRSAGAVANFETPAVKHLEVNTAKDSDSEVFSNITLINKAINEKKMLTFHYFDYDLEHNRVYRDHDRVYKVTCIDTILRDNKYYLICLIKTHEDSYTVFRIDKMDMVKLSLTSSTDSPLIEDFNTADFSNQVFLMFNGPLKTYRLKVPNLPYMPGIIFDNLGHNFKIYEETKEYFIIDAEVRESPKFLSWLENYQIEIVKILNIK